MHTECTIHKAADDAQGIEDVATGFIAAIQSEQQQHDHSPANSAVNVTTPMHDTPSVSMILALIPAYAVGGALFRMFLSGSSVAPVDSNAVAIVLPIYFASLLANVG